ncbi:PD-(D/E)XK nuclease family protein [Campylobacter coli]|nr:PD-(D/E)XK nuclease family protein [Campylobacter coli]
MDFLEEFETFKVRETGGKKIKYNLLLKVLPAHDEVNLHSGILKSLLDPSENHNQDRLFLDLFLKEVNLKDLFANDNEIKVEKEYKNIDIYIHNNAKHIILENKIWARDQHRQIARYINTLKDEGVKYENIIVIYLTLDGRKPDDNSLGDWKINGSFLENQESKIAYRQISYKDQILLWLDKCKPEVEKLKIAIEFYKDVIENLMGKGSDMISFLNDKGDKLDLEELFKDLISNKSKLLPKISILERNYIINQFLEKICTEFNKFDFDNGSNHVQFILKPKKLDDNVYFAFAWFDTTNPKNWKNFGIRLIGDISKEYREKIRNEIQKEKIDEKFNGFALSNYIVFDEKTTAKGIKEFIKENIDTFIKVNEILKN